MYHARARAGIDFSESGAGRTVLSSCSDSSPLFLFFFLKKNIHPSIHPSTRKKRKKETSCYKPHKASSPSLLRNANGPHIKEWAVILSSRLPNAMQRASERASSDGRDVTLSGHPVHPLAQSTSCNAVRCCCCRCLCSHFIHHFGAVLPPMNVSTFDFFCESTASGWIRLSV